MRTALDFIVRHAAALHVAFMACYLAWARGGSAPAFYWPIAWLSFGIMEIMLLLPPTRKDEAPSAARARCRRSLLRDPVLYVGMALLFFLLIQWLNGPRALVRNAETGVWSYTPPPLEGMPSCVDRGEAGQVLLWALAALSASLGVRHGLSKRAKLLLLRLLAFNGAVLAIFGLVQLASGTSRIFWVKPLDVYFFASFGYPNHAGAFFVLLFILNGGLLIHALAEPTGKRMTWGLAVALVLNLLGVTFSLSRAAILMAWAALPCMAVYGLLYLRTRVAPARLLKGAIGTAVAAAAVIVLALSPVSPVRREMSTLTVQAFAERMNTDLLREGAWMIWQDHPWAGVGGWGFRRFVGLYIGEDRWDKLQSAGRANVHSDLLQFLCEHGIAGLGLMLATVFILLAPVWFRITRLSRVPADQKADEGRSVILRVSPITWAILAGTSATVIHSFIDLPFRSAAIIVLWFICLAAAPAFVPRVKSVPVAAPARGGREDRSGAGNARGRKRMAEGSSRERDSRRGKE